MNNGSITIAGLLATMPQVGRLDWIGIREVKREPLTVLEQVEVIENRGLVGDHRTQREDGKRQVTIIQAEHFPVLEAITGHDVIPPEWLRRNLVVSGINLYALRKARFMIGDVLLQGSGNCPPCSRMEKILGPGGYNAMRGHGGINAQVIWGGEIKIGDAVKYVDEE
ncbi:MAG: MOSC domain-containing protein [Sulfuriflexus sp.]|nr:MOSC domain-containing protein [Sulfuriflexus sp.]